MTGVLTPRSTASDAVVAPARWRMTAAAVGPLGSAAAGVFLLIVLVAVLAPVLAPHDPHAVNLANVYAPPSAAHPLGTDDTGRDLLSRLIHGARFSLLGPLLVIAASALTGTALGVACAWLRGSFDMVVSRLFDLLFAFPAVLLAILATTIFGVGFSAAVVALAVAYVPVVGRVMRAAALKERSLPYIEALQLQGLSGLSICVRHLIPNIAPLLLVQCTVGFGYAMLDLSAISFLGLGTQPPTADWGVMVAAGKTSILSGQPEQSIFAAVLIVITVVSVNLVGERLAHHFEVGDQS